MEGVVDQRTQRSVTLPRAQAAHLGHHSASGFAEIDDPVVGGMASSVKVMAAG